MHTRPIHIHDFAKRLAAGWLAVFAVFMLPTPTATAQVALNDRLNASPNNSTAAAAAGGAGYDRENYRMGPGDSIDIRVYDTPELSLTTRINESGKINYPLLGQIELEGKTEAQAADAIGSRLVDADILRQANVTVTVDSFRSQRVTVVGSVPEPGEFFLSDERDIVDLLAKAGWITETGADHILLTRRSDNGQSSQQRIALDELTSGQHQGMQAKPGDRIFVPKQDIFYIQGEVQAPGAYRYASDMTVMEAISIGGGVTPRGSRSRLEVKRRDAQGNIESYDADPTDRIRPNDTLLVKERFF